MKNLSKPKASFTRFIKLSWYQKFLLGKAFIVLAVYKCLLFIFPFNFFFKKSINLVSSPVAPDEQNLVVIVWAISVVSNRIPLGFTCLVQALAAKWLLRKYPDVHICIGVHKSASQAFSAHAWVVYKNKVILGEQETQVFQPILEWN
ncbi:lasso peptide biosynthesis B2 protein [Spirosoma endbachense]|uniref:Lasso peptide biosynthesis B2 protein n=1 Tax=Spirosoma endbachense TaxID=2666025 RepID=A0A6P1VP70_9BACT|nr:lasso peptide biosynthesis B2 protein [Spirosoma endbachense]QHV94873.1 lasso peptide biosynthesis B2 protein [Spirosoma endbachense]